MAKIHTNIISFTEGAQFHMYKFYSDADNKDCMNDVLKTFNFIDNFCYIAEYDEVFPEGEYPDGYEDGYIEVIRLSVGDTDRSAIWQYGQKMYF